MTTDCQIEYCNHPNGPCIGACLQKIEQWREEARQRTPITTGTQNLEPTPQAATPSAIENTLTERGKRYGKFTGHAAITQGIKAVMFNSRQDLTLAPDQREALEMIAHKIGRIVNGDPDYADSWVDIAGYAKLVADRLEGVER